MYLVMFAERIYGRLELVRVPYCTKVVCSKGLVGLARVAKVGRP
jgi:hypothetical protein